MELSTRMKRFELASSPQLPDRLPVIVRVDGKAFHTYTSSLSKNNTDLIATMWSAARALCEQIVGAKVAYVQSDEISVLIYPWANHNSQPWYDNTLQKIVSVSASIASATVTAESIPIFGKIKPAYFDSRAFVLPEREVNNYFIWRQQDAIRNSVQTQMRIHFSHKDSQGKNQTEMLEALQRKGVDWNALPTYIQRGACVIRKSAFIATRMKWDIDVNTPNFVADPSYINGRFIVDEDQPDEEMIKQDAVAS